MRLADTKRFDTKQFDTSRLVKQVARHATLMGTALMLSTGWLAAGCSPETGAAQARDKVMLNPKNAQQVEAANLLMTGTQQLHDKKAFQARPTLERAAKLWPDCGYIQYNLGFAYHECGQLEQATVAFRKALALNPDLTDCILNIGSCYQVLNKPDEAIKWFQEYLKRCPHAADAEQVAGMIKALERQESRQVDSDPQAADYLPSVCGEEGRPHRWSLSNLPLKIYISNGTDASGRPVRGFRENYNMLLVEALDSWAKASNNRLAYIFVTDARAAHIICTWTDNVAFLQERGNKVEQGVARVASRDSGDGNVEIGHVDVIILVKKLEGEGNLSDDEMKKACLHEIGHALGMAGHSTNNKDIMFFSDSPTVWPALTKRDKATMYKLYGGYPEYNAYTPQLWRQ